MVATRVADVYLRPPTTKAIKVRPNVTLRFRSGYAAVYDERVMVPLLRRPDVVVALTERYAEQVSAWLQECDDLHPARAEIQLPEGFTLGPAPDYRVHTPFPDITPPPVPPPSTDPATEIAALRAELEALRAALPPTSAEEVASSSALPTTADDLAAWLANVKEQFGEAESVPRVRQEGGGGPGGAAGAQAEAPDSAGDAGPAAAAEPVIGDDPAAPAAEPEPPRPQRRVLTPAQKKKANARKAAARKKARQAQARA
jgi:hypothetical protein